VPVRRPPCHASFAVPVRWLSFCTSVVISCFSVIRRDGFQTVFVLPPDALPCSCAGRRAVCRSSCRASVAVPMRRLPRACASAAIPCLLVIRRAAKDPQLCYPAVSCRRVFAVPHTGRRARASAAIPRLLVIRRAAIVPSRVATCRRVFAVPCVGRHAHVSVVVPVRRLSCPCVGCHSVSSCHPARREGPQPCRPTIGCVVVLMRRLPCRVSVVVPRVGRRAHASAAPCLCVGRHSVPSRHPARRKGLQPCRPAIGCVVVLMRRLPCRASAAIPCLPVIRHAAKGLSRVVRPSDALPCSCAGRRSRTSVAVSCVGCHSMLFCYSERREGSQAAPPVCRTRCRAVCRSPFRASAAVSRLPVIRRAAKEGPKPCRPVAGCLPCRTSVVVPMRQLPCRARLLF